MAKRWVLVYQRLLVGENEDNPPVIELLDAEEFSAWMRGENRPKTPITFEIYILGAKTVWSKDGKNEV
jgi:NOL1/NOP2/fmu family ribosome biogenesis protein